jgi:hypothetical protein
MRTPRGYVPEGWAWVSCSREVEWEFGRWRHLAKVGELLHSNWVTTACGATGSGVGTFRRDNRKVKCTQCDLFASGFARGAGVVSD